MDGKRVKQLTRNKRFLFFTNLFTEVKSVNAVIQLFYLSRGLNIGQIVYLSLVWTLVILLVELPSSYLADVIGRKKTIILGVIFMILGNIAMLFVHGFYGVSLAVILLAIGFAFNSGTDEALLYDTLKELGQENFSTKVSGKYFSSSYLAKIFIPFLGTFIAKDLLPWQFLMLIFLDLSGTVLALCFSFMLIEPKRFEKQSDKKISIFKESIKIITGNKVLLKFSLNKILIFQASFVYWRVYQIILRNYGISVFWLGLIYVFMQGSQFFIHWNIEKIRQKIGEMPIFWISPVFGTLFITLIILFPAKAVLFIGSVILMIVGTYRDPVFLTQMQKRIGSFNRATTTSALSFIKSISDVPLLLLLAYLVNLNVNYALFVTLILFLTAGLLFPIKREDLIVVK